MDYPPYPIDNRIIFTEEISPEKILTWERKDREKLGYSKKSMSHPAKMDISLTQWIITNLTEENEIILDPMAGIGTTLTEASRLGRHAIGVEYEERFVNWIKENLENLKKQSILGKKGEAKIILGDARNLSEILSKQVDGIVFSPPYAPTARPQNQHSYTLEELDKRRGYKTTGFRAGYGKNPENIGNLRYGKVDAVVMSPPFSQANKGGGIAKRGYEGKHGKDEKLHERHERKFSDDEDNISNLPHGEISAIVMSPPYSNSLSNKNLDLDKQVERMRKAGISKKRIKTFLGKYSGMRHEKGAYTDKNSDNIGNLPQGNIDVILTSPPYQDVIKEGKEGTDATSNPGRWKKEFSRKKVTGSGYSTVDAIITSPGEISTIITSPPYGNRLSDDRVEDGDEARMSYRQVVKGEREKQTCTEKGIHPSTYSKDKENLGNLKGKNYLTEMLKVYQECYKVLKKGGKAIIVTKNFTRNYQMVRLDMDTIRLMEVAGFRLVDRYFRKLTYKSFWILNYEKKFREKFPDKPLPTAQYEDILIFEKKC